MYTYINIRMDKITQTTISVDRATKEGLKEIAYFRRKTQTQLIRDWVAREQEAMRKLKNYA